MIHGYTTAHRPLPDACCRAAWDRYTPGPDSPWNLARVVHLHRRAGFAATWQELQRDLGDGPHRSIDRLLSSTARAQGVPADFAAVADKLVERAANDIGRLKAWWIYRMIAGPDPLGERLALFWHDHFATSAAKVGPMIRRQNEIFREFGRAPYGELLKRVVHDPALLVWLDASENTRGRPNENLARELMELFTIGVGIYTETDVKEAARALTGWTVEDGRFRDDPVEHDDGEKTILTQSGRWRGDDLIAMLLAHPATSRRLAERICRLLLAEAAVSDDDVGALAAGLRERSLDVGWAIETVLRSRRFFAAESLGRSVPGPPEFVVGAVRALEMFDPLPNTLILAEWVESLGQDLFYPPSVGGWAGGRAWLTTRGAIGRARFAADLVAGRPVGLLEPADVQSLAARHGRDGGLGDQVAFFAELFTGIAPSPEWRDRIVKIASRLRADKPEAVRCAVALFLASPMAQLS
jgi:uncharacterized protein (DUF1800 family)